MASAFLQNTTGCLDNSEALNGSRAALGLPLPVVVDGGPDADEQAVGETGCPDDARDL